MRIRSRPAALALVLTGAVLFADGGTPSTAGEGALLRWCRTAADHPWRTGLAFFLLASAVGSRERRGPSDDGPAPPRERSGFELG